LDAEIIDETHLTECKCCDYEHLHYVELGGMYLNVTDNCDKVNWNGYMYLSKTEHERIDKTKILDKLCPYRFSTHQGTTFAVAGISAL
jgi:hypothetical protein